MHILMVAAENDALPGGKVGGIGDVLRDIPIELAKAKQTVDVVMPSYGAIAQATGAKQIALLDVLFTGRSYPVVLYKVPRSTSKQGKQGQVQQWLLEHPLFSAGGIGKIYCHDPADQPYATDANKFALFSAAVATALIQGKLAMPDVLHLHDWHAALVAVLRQFHPNFSPLKAAKMVFTIHNLAYQGIRPLADHESSLASWFPELRYKAEVIIDPIHQNCINVMRAGITLSDRIHVVSPSYGEEILQQARAHQGFTGGEGLEKDLREAQQQGRLVGILNGCDYSQPLPSKPSKHKLQQAIENCLFSWIGQQEQLSTNHFLAHQRLKQWQASRRKNQILITAISRLTDQKMSIFCQKSLSKSYALERLLEQLGTNGVFVLLGCGEPHIAQQMTTIMSRHSNFLFLNGYDAELSQQLFLAGDLFLMPSSFEPCGITQMLAMRAGQPCLVHHVGGLKDTVKDDVNGFVFTGDDVDQQASNMVKKFVNTIEIKLHQPQRWQQVVTNALQSRFFWQDSVKLYIKQLYK